ncbi:MAG: signal peptide peptidase SppA [Minisyncoccia bacterium]|jgi:protease-4
MKVNFSSRPVQYTIVGIILIVCLGITVFVTGKELLKLAGSNQDFTTATGGKCNIAIIPLVGQIFASQADADAQNASDNSSTVSAEYVLQEIERAQNDRSIKGVVLRVDSPGGSPVGGSLIANALKRLNKPSVALIWGQGDSAAYLAATGANTIIASPSSDIGDIGVTDSYLDQSGKDIQDGQKFIQIAAGTYKDTGNPDKPLSSDEQALLQQEVNEVYQNFVQAVAKNRGMSVDAVKDLADGESFVASTATSTGLIDSLGDSETARVWFQQKLGKWSDPVLCE